MNNQDRIRLAEAMGWMRCPDQNGAVIDLWMHRERWPERWFNLDELPDPFTDANDCDAVIAKLNERFDIGIRFHREHGHSIEIYGVGGQGNKPLHWSGDDYKTGVCELALKVLGKSDEGVP